MARRTYKYYDLVMAAFVTVLLCSNLIGAAKVATVGPFNLGLFSLGPFTFGAGVLFFPISYIFGDVLTEVYGYARARKVVWAGFSAVIFASFMSWIVVGLRPAPGWPVQVLPSSPGANRRYVAGCARPARYPPRAVHHEPP